MPTAAMRKRQSPPADPLRQALVDAIADLAEAQRRVANNAMATRKCWSALTAAEAAAAKAERGIAEARVSAAADFADAMEVDPDDTLPASGMVALARASHADALETIESVRVSRDQLRRALPDLEADARTASAAVDAAISEIIAPHAQRLIDKLQALIAEATPLRQLIRDLLNGHLAQNFGYGALKPLQPQLDAALVVMRHPDTGHAAGVFAAIRAALRADPFAVIEWPGA